MKKYLLSFLTIFIHLQAYQPFIPWEESYHYYLVNEASYHIAELSKFPVMRYPNKNFASLANLFPDNKILLFGYGSLMHPASAHRNLPSCTVSTMRPVIALGLKRIFNYKSTPGEHWGMDLDPKEKAMLNVMPMTTYASIVNGVVFELSVSDLKNLVGRETGYDLAPVIIVDWQDIENRAEYPHIQIAYTFIVPEEVRCGIVYNDRNHYPVRGYLRLVREGARQIGENFLALFEETTFLGNGTELIKEWDETFYPKPCTAE